MNEALKAKGEKRQNISISRNSEFVADSNNVFSAKHIRAERDVYILNDSIIIGDRLPFSGRDNPSFIGIDNLEQQMRTLFVTLGYHCEHHYVRTNYFFEWIINIPSPRKGYDRILVRGIEGEAKISDVAALRQVVKKQQTDQGWIVTVRRISQAARNEVKKKANGKLLCYTLDELQDEQADFSRYFRWLEDEVKRRDIDKNYIPLACIKEEFDPITKKKMGESHYDELNGWIDSYIDLWLDDPTKEHISILGEFGTGKTWFALHYTWVAPQRYRNAKERGLERPRIPLYIPLQDFTKAASIESFFFASFSANMRFTCATMLPLSNLTAWANFC